MFNILIVVTMLVSLAADENLPNSSRITYGAQNYVDILTKPIAHIIIQFILVILRAVSGFS